MGSNRTLIPGPQYGYCLIGVLFLITFSGILMTLGGGATTIFLGGGGGFGSSTGYSSLSIG